MQRAALMALLAFAAVAVGADHVVHGRTFSLPDGFVIERVAGPPLVKHPVHAAFDDQGRLLVTEVSGSNAPIKEQLKTLEHKVLRLTDDNNDGVFDRSEVWAKDLPMPQGILWYEGSAYVAAPPAIWKLQSKPDDSGSLPKTAWYDPKTATGCNNDLHGPWLGPDGWFYWTKGAFAEQTHELVNGKKLTTRASMLLRRKPEGGPVDVLMTGGMDNPVGLAFLPNGDRIVSATFLHHPSGGLRDGLIHALYGGVYGKDHDAIAGLPRTGPLLPVMTDLGPAAPSALIRYEGDGLGEQYRDNLFLCQFNLRKVSCHEVFDVGASYRTRDGDFLSSPDIDFHPTDVIQDADGSLLVVDTGGWYKLCCPTSQLAKPEIPGGIYRIRRKNAERIDDPRGSRINWAACTEEDLVSVLSNSASRPAVAKRAIAELVKRGPTAVPEIERRWRITWDDRPEAGHFRINAIWCVAQIEGPAATEELQWRALDREERYRLAATNALAARRDKCVDRMRELLKAGSPTGRRAASEALGRIGHGSREAVEDLLEAAAQVEGFRAKGPLPEHSRRNLTHAIRYALFELDDPELVDELGEVKFRSPLSKAAALWAVSQNPMWTPTWIRVWDLLRWVEDPDPELAAAARFSLQQRPAFAERGVEWLKLRFVRKPRTDPGWDTLRPLMAAWVGRADLQKLLTEWCRSPDAGVRLYCWSLMGELPGKAMPAAWMQSAVKRLADANGDEVAAILKLVQRAPIKDVPLQEAAQRRSTERELPAELRFSLIALAPPRATGDETFKELIDALSPDQPFTLRGAAAEALGKSKLSEAQLATLAQSLKECGPLEIERLLPAFTATPTPAVGETLVAALMQAKARKALRVDDLGQRLKAFGPSLQPAAEKLFARFAEDRATETQRLEQLLATLPAGDAKRGLVVFNGTKASCRACHKLGYVGGDLGPDLSRIGAVRNRRDLLESVAFPSASFVRSYEPTLFLLKDGRTVSGLVRRETAADLLIATGVNQEQRIAKADVESRQTGTVSVMPAGMDQQLSPQELADLLAFLQSAK